MRLNPFWRQARWLRILERYYREVGELERNQVRRRIGRKCWKLPVNLCSYLSAIPSNASLTHLKNGKADLEADFGCREGCVLQAAEPD